MTHSDTEGGLVQGRFDNPARYRRRVHIAGLWCARNNEGVFNDDVQRLRGRICPDTAAKEYLDRCGRIDVLGQSKPGNHKLWIGGQVATCVDHSIADRLGRI